jgi:hypothetical protein
MSKATVTINGVEATSGREGQFWALTDGPFPPEIPMLVHDDLSQSLAALPDPVSLEFKGDVWVGTEKRETDRSVTGVYLTRRDGVVKGHRHQWFMTDVRQYWENLWVFSDFSVRRQLNEFIGFGVGGQEEFNRTPRFAYIPVTQRDGASLAEDPQFVSGDVDPENHAPWTAKLAVMWMLKGFFKTEAGRFKTPDGRESVEVVDAASDNGRRLVDFRSNRPWPYVMAKLLKLAHIGMFIDYESRVVLYDLDPVSLSDLGGYRGGGSPRVADNSRRRPSRVRVYFRTERELRFDFSESLTPTGSASQQKGRRDVSLTLENVLILPQAVREVATGRTFQRGQIVTIQQALDLWNQDPDNPAPPLLSSTGTPGSPIKFNLEFIRRNIASPALATRMTLQTRFANNQDSVFSARAAALYQSYRQLFRFPPAWLDMIEGIRLERCAIMDPITGKRAPSPVFMDYFQEWSGRYFLFKGFPAGKDLPGGQNVFCWSSSDPANNKSDTSLQGVANPALLPLDKGQPAPATLSWVNRRQGVFKASFLTDLYGNTIRFFPTTFPTIPTTRIGGVAQTWFLKQCVFSAVWRFSTVVSATMRTPNDQRKLYHIEFSPTTTPAVDLDARGPAVEVLFSSTHAGIAWLDAAQLDPQGKVLQESSAVQVTNTPAGEQVVVKGGALVNPAVLQDAAIAVLEDIKFRTRDNTLGVFRRPGLVDEDVPRGQVTSVTIQHVNGRIESVHAAGNPPSPPTIWERLPEAVRNFLYRIEGAPNP